MIPTVEGTLLRIYVGESDRAGSHPLYEALVLKARELHLAGATVLRGCMGFGVHSKVHTAKVLRLSEDLPMVVEIVDRAEAVQRFLLAVKDLIGEGLVTMEKLDIVLHRPAESERWSR